MSLVVMYLAGAVVDACARVVAVLRRAVWVAVAVGVVLLLDGCATVALQGAPWTEPFARYEPSALPIVPDDVPPAVGVREGDPAPFGGVLFAEEEIDEIQVAAEQRDVLVDALGVAYRGRAEDRAAAEVVLAAREEQLRQARLAAPRWFVAGGVAGGGAVLAVLLAVVLGTPR